MLAYLKIKNFAIIDEIELEFTDGMTVITGETGAGKSLLVDTLALMLGDRADNSMIKAGADRCEIAATFAINQLSTIQQWLIAKDFINDDSDSADPNSITECIIYRTFNQSGRSRSSINGIPCTLQMVKDLGNLLLDLHGQHEHHALLKNETQRHLLDTYANNETAIAKIKYLYTEWNKLHKELAHLEEHTQDQDDKISFLNYQLQELDNLADDIAELESLKHEYSLLSNAGEIINNCQTVLNLASENEKTNILSLINTANNFLEKIIAKDPKVENLCQLWENARINLEEGVNELQHYLDHIELNQERMEQLETRLQNIYNLARKHKVKPEELPQLYNSLLKQLTDFTAAGENLAQIKAQMERVANEYHAVANQISKIRRQAATKLNQLITDKMQHLGMPDGQFQINIMANKDPQQLTSYGLESVEFLVAANIGQPLQSLNKVASGGELSRISLALQVILSSTATTPTLIFDEVDVGIGGKTAEIVGNLLRELSTKNQVICVTHLPQVACCGHHHLQVEKYTEKKNTKFKVTPLSPAERINEIARMLGGINITKQALAHAKEMLQQHK